MTQDRPHIPLAIVAAEAGVSVPTVSKVLNGRSDVAEATGHHAPPRRGDSRRLRVGDRKSVV